MLDINSVIHVFKFCQLLAYRMLQSVTEFYRVLQSVTEYNRVFPLPLPEPIVTEGTIRIGQKHGIK